MNIEIVWNRILANEGKEFLTKTGKSFYYSIKANVLKPNHTNRNLPKSEFEKALTRLPLVKTTQLKDLQGYAYIFGILTDKRII